MANIDIIQGIISRQHGTCMICKKQNIHLNHSRDRVLRCESCFTKYAKEVCG